MAALYNTPVKSYSKKPYEEHLCTMRLKLKIPATVSSVVQLVYWLSDLLKYDPNERDFKEKLNIFWGNYDRNFNNYLMFVHKIWSYKARRWLDNFSIKIGSSKKWLNNSVQKVLLPVGYLTNEYIILTCLICRGKKRKNDN